MTLKQEIVDRLGLIYKDKQYEIPSTNLVIIPEYHKGNHLIATKSGRKVLLVYDDFLLDIELQFWNMIIKPS